MEHSERRLVAKPAALRPPGGEPCALAGIKHRDDDPEDELAMTFARCPSLLEFERNVRVRSISGVGSMGKGKWDSCRCKALALP